jgi:hypothetical protein
MQVKLVLSHTHECPDCNEAYECFCDATELLKQCPDCFMQLKLIEFNDEH